MDDETGVKSSLEEAYAAMDRDILDEINRQEYDDLNFLSKSIIKGTLIGQSSDFLASRFGEYSPNYSVAVALYKHALHGDGEKQYFPLGTGASELISNHSSFITEVKNLVLICRLVKVKYNILPLRQILMLKLHSEIKVWC